MVADVAARLGGVDIVVNNAGVGIPTAIDGDDFDAAWDTTLGVNLRGQVRMIRAVLPHLRRSSHGRIVNVASTEGLGATPYLSPYTVSKHGVIGLTRALAVELGSTGITVNCVCPGPIRTTMTAAIPDDAKQTFARRRVPSWSLRRARGGRSCHRVTRPAIDELRHGRRARGRRRLDRQERLVGRPPARAVGTAVAVRVALLMWPDAT